MASSGTGRSRSVHVGRDRSGLTDFWLVLGCFFLSGFAALVYQTVWMRQFAVVFGTSELAIATVLAAYMGGLAFGAAIAGRYARHIQRPVWVYGILELGIAVGAILVPFGIRAARGLQAAVIGGKSYLPHAEGLAQPLFYVSVAFLLLLVPTACMGATLPLLTRYAVRRNDQIGRRVGALYSINTFGAVLGTLAAGFLFLPRLGLFETTLLAVLANVAVFGIAVWLARREHSGAVSSVAEAPEATVPSSLPTATGRFSRHSLILPMMLVSGMVAFTYEVMWSRLLGHVIGGSVYAFCTMLATFLTGITLGSSLASRLATRPHVAIWGFAVCQLGCALASMFTFALVDRVPEIAAHLGAGAASGPELMANAALCALVLLPSTVFIGGTYPFGVRILAGSAEDAGPVSGKVYSWNTIGSVAGALLSGFWIVPTLGFEGTIRACVAVSLLLAASTVLAMGQIGIQWRTGWSIACLAVLALFHPTSPERILSASPLVDQKFRGKVVFQKVGRSSTVRLTDRTGFYLLQNNGLPEAIVGLKGTPPYGGGLHRWLTALPLVARPEADSLLVIGFGGGTAVDRVPRSVRRIDVIELEPEVIEANRLIASYRDHDPLADPRVRVILNDARGALSLSKRQYDVIVSQPSHPWTAGASHLYTREFMELARDHLTEDGVFLQWLTTDFLDEELFKSLGATLLSVFDHVRLYQPTSTSLFYLASNSPLEPESKLIRTGEPLVSHYAEYSRLPLNGINDLLAILTLDERGLRELCEGAPLNTDNRNRLAFQSAPTKNKDEGEAISQLCRPYDPLIRRDSSVYADPELVRNMSPAAIVRGICTLGQWSRVDDYVATFDHPGREEFLKAVIAVSLALPDEARHRLRKAVAADPLSNELRFLLCEQHVKDLIAGRAPEEVRLAAELLRDPERAVLEGLLALQRNDFETLARLEPRLSEVRTDRYAYVHALYCRAAWRAIPTGDPRQEIWAREGIELVDQAMSIWRRGQGYMMRLNAAALADEPLLMLETARQYALFLTQDIDLPEVRRQASEQLPALKRVTKKLRHDPRADADAVAEVESFLTEFSRRLNRAEPRQTLVQPASYER